MGHALEALKTDLFLLKAMEEAAAVKPSSQELFEQRVSFVYGSMKPESDVTRERVKQILIEQGAVQP